MPLGLRVMALFLVFGGLGTFAFPMFLLLASTYDASVVAFIVAATITCAIEGTIGIAFLRRRRWGLRLMTWLLAIYAVWLCGWALASSWSTEVIAAVAIGFALGAALLMRSLRSDSVRARFS